MMEIMKGGIVILKAYRVKNLYVSSVESCISVNSVHDDCNDLWHKCLGHTSSKGLETLHKNHYSGEMIICYELPLCDAYMYWKQTFVKFPTSLTPNPSKCGYILA